MNQSSDIKGENMNAFKEGFSRNYRLASEKFKTAIEEIDKTIKSLQKMKEEYGTDTKDVIAAIGPSICQDCYEVSEDVIDQFKEAFDSKYWDDLFYQKENKKYQLNLWKANEIIMLEAGVKRENIAVTNVCTSCNSDILYSHRASKGQRGGLAAFMALK